MYFFLLTLGCATTPDEAPAALDVPDGNIAALADVGSGADAPPEALGDAEPSADALDPGDPRVLYNQCRDRVEGIEADGECSQDSDCVAAGCSHEVCLEKANAQGLMSTCEVLPCFSVLHSCGCAAGRCQWTLGERADQPPMGTLPPKNRPPAE